MHWSYKLNTLRACKDAVEYAKGFETFAEAWNKCERGDWMLWIAAKVTYDRKQLVRAACECARLALPYVKKGELRPLRAIEIAEAWTKGEATLEDVHSAASAADDASAVDDAAYAAAYAAFSAAHAAFSTFYPAYASYAADDAYAAASYDATKEKVSKQCADIARKYYQPLINTGLQEPKLDINAQWNEIIAKGK
jgi:hypothetical protein